MRRTNSDYLIPFKKKVIKPFILRTTAFIILISVLMVVPSVAEPHTLHNGWTEWTEATYLPETSGNYYLVNDVTLTEAWSVPSGVVNLCLNGHDICLVRGATGSVIIVPAKSTLNLDDCLGNEGVICGGNTNTEPKAIDTGKGSLPVNVIDEGGIVVYGIFNMNGGIISGNTATYGGGGVDVHGKFNMNGGIISGNTAQNGGGVKVSGEFYLNDGTIKGNTAMQHHGGGVYINCGTFTMNGGTISNNNAAYGGGGIGMSGHSIDYTSGKETINSGTIILKNGVITDNNAQAYGGGIYSGGDYNKIIIDGGIISENTAQSGGGVAVQSRSSFTMNNGDISNNDGGGVSLSFETTGTMNGGSISDNKDGWGGGVDVMQSSFTMTGGKIIGNEGVSGGIFLSASNGKIVDGIISGNVGNNGGGISVFSESTLSMLGGEISSNTAKSMCACGGGVYVTIGSDFTMLGGTITDNTVIGEYNSGGGGIYIQGYDTPNTVKITGGSISENVVTSNNGQGGGIYIGNGNTFTLENGNVIGNKITGNNGCGGGIWMSHMTTHVKINNGYIAENIADIGGGVYIEGGAYYYDGTTPDGVYMKGGLLNLNGGLITNNIADIGGGVYVGGGSYNSENQCMEGGTLVIGGKGTVDKNNDVYLSEKTVITVDSTFKESGGIYNIYPCDMIKDGDIIVNDGAMYVEQFALSQKLKRKSLSAEGDNLILIKSTSQSNNGNSFDSMSNSNYNGVEDVASPAPLFSIIAGFLVALHILRNKHQK